jgi:hypothetical protein
MNCPNPESRDYHQEVDVARTPENENLSRETYQDERHQQQLAYQSAQTDVGQFNKNTDTLEKGGQVAADPFLNAGYLANQNRLQSYATEGENDAAKQSLEDSDRRSGGQNTSATQATIADLARGKMRLGNQLTAQRSAQDYRSNLDYQQHMVEMPLQAAGGCDCLQLIQKCDRDCDHNQCHHQHGLPLVDPLEQFVQSQRNEDKTGLADEVARDAEAKQRLGGRDVAGRRRCVSLHDQFAGNIDEGKEARDRHEYIKQACEPAGVPSGGHVSSLVTV